MGAKLTKEQYQREMDRVITTRRLVYQDSIAQYAKRIEKEVEKLKSLEAGVKLWYDTLQLLQEADFECELRSWDERVIVTLKQRDELLRLVNLVGRFDGDQEHRDIYSVTPPRAISMVPCVKYPFLWAHLIIDLDESSRCQIEAIERPAYTEHQLTCKR